MSDKEEVQVRGHEDSSGDESSSEAAVTKNGFSHDGEPVNRPRKVSNLFLQKGWLLLSRPTSNGQLMQLSRVVVVGVVPKNPY